MSESTERETAPVDRRGFLGAAALALAGLTGAAAVAVGAVYAVAPALRGRAAKREDAWSPVPDARPSRAGAPGRHAVTVVADAGWAKTQSTYAIFVDATPSGAPVAFSARCPHEGCQVEWRGDQDQFVCPCHNSVWSRDGERRSGPTKRGLDPLDVRGGESGELEVRYETFMLDTPDRVPVS